MNKLYYTCRIEAAYMAEKFGVKFDFENSWQGVKPPKLINELYKNYPEHYKPAVSTASLSIFEPQQGDIGINELNTPGEYRTDLCANENAFFTDEGLSLGSDLEIICRNRIRFFAPKKEKSCQNS